MKRKLQEPAPRKQPAWRKQMLATISGDLANRRRRPALELRRTMDRSRVPQRVHQPEPGVPKSEADTQRQLHQLQVHQIELEMRNAELQQARDQLEVALEKYTDLYDFAPVGYFTLTAAGAIQLVNLTGSHLVGIERSRLVGQSFSRLVSAQLRPGFNSFLKQVFASPARQSRDFELVRPGQPPRAVNIEAQRLLNGQECRAAVVDIAERKRAEEKLQVSEVRYRRLFEAAHDGVLLLDPNTRKITDANPFMTRMLGYPRDQLVGKELFEIGLLKDETANQEVFRKLKKLRQVRYEDLPLESRAGRHQEVEVVANLYQENGHAVIQCNIRDITERKRAEELLRRNEALFSALVEQAPVGVYVVNDQLCLQQVNPKAQPAFRKVQPVKDRSLSQIMNILWPKKTAGEIMARFRHTLKTGQPYYAPEFSERRRDTGVTETYEWQLQRITLPAGHHGVVCFFNDITERKLAEATRRRNAVLTASNWKLEQEVARRQTVEESLTQSQQHQSRLLQQAHHLQDELRHLSRQVLRAQEEERKRISRELHDVIAQTLTGINVRLAGLKITATRNPAGVEQQIARTQQLVEHSVNIVHQFARELRPAVLDDLGLIPALQAVLKHFQAETGIRVRLSAFAEVEQVSGDKRTVLYRVAQEALTNIARHAQARRADVKIRKLNDTICMTIKDAGKGFHQERALRGKKTDRMGLLGMRERVEMVGGSFAVKSAPGRGTTVQVQIPLAEMRGGGAGKLADGIP